LVNVANDSSLKYVTFPLLLASYGLLTLKTRLQIAGSPLSYQVADNSKILDNIVRRETVRGLYSGFVPFVVLNLAAAYCLPSLLSENKKKESLSAIARSAPEAGLTGDSHHWS